MGDNNRDPSMEEILASIKRVIAEDAPPPRAPAAARARPDEEEDVLELSDPLVSDDTASATRHSLASLAGMRKASDPAPAAAAGALEAAVREMLKPMLKEWLDQRLPDIIDEIVQREIQRITRGKDI